MILWWTFFGVFIFAMLALDLGVFNRKVHVIKMKESLLWTAFWVTLALAFGLYLCRRRSPQCLQLGHVYFRSFSDFYRHQNGVEQRDGSSS
jgi:hypothetical protein